MDTMSPPAKGRRRLVLAFLGFFTVAFFALLVYTVVRWQQGARGLPLLAAVGGVGAFVGLWRWIIERSRRESGDLPPATTTTTMSDAIVKILVWAHEPGSALRAIGILVLLHTVSAVLFQFATGSTVIEAAGGVALLWIGEFLRAHVRGSGQAQGHSKGKTEKSAE